MGCSDKSNSAHSFRGLSLTQKPFINRKLQHDQTPTSRMKSCYEHTERKKQRDPEGLYGGGDIPTEPARLSESTWDLTGETGVPLTLHVFGYREQGVQRSCCLWQHRTFGKLAFWQVAECHLMRVLALNCTRLVSLSNMTSCRDSPTVFCRVAECLV